MAANRKAITDQDVEKALESEAATNPKALQILVCQFAAKANRDPKQVKPLVEFIDAHPGLFKQMSVVAYSIRQSLIRKICGEKSEGSAITLRGEYNALFDRLSTEDDTDMEKLMISRIAMSWLRVLSAEAACIVLMGSTGTFRELTIADKLLTRAHSRYVKSIESLARLRKLRANTKAANAQASILDMKEKTIRAHINTNNPNVLNASHGLREVEKKRA
jgi:hypothetical protein